MSAADPERGALTREALPEDRGFDERLRPGSLAEMVGQNRLRENLAVFIDAARRRGEPLDHLLFEYSKQGTPRHRRIRRNIHEYSIILLDEGDVACKIGRVVGQAR